MTTKLDDAEHRPSSLLAFKSEADELRAFEGFRRSIAEWEAQPLNYQVPDQANEMVNHPKHYNAYGVECIVVAEQMPFNLGSALKYLWRCGKKPGATTIEDLSKAKWYIDREIQRLLGEATPPAYHQAEVYGEK